MQPDDDTDAAPARPILEYPCGEPPAPGRAVEVAPGVLWLRMQLPMQLNHINLWAVREGDGWAVFDTGMQTPDTTAAWRQLFGADDGLAQRPLTRVFVTHMHPDHVGMAGFLTRKFDVKLWMTRSEYLSCRMLAADTGREAPAEAIAFYRRAGWDDEAIEIYRTRFGNFGRVIHALPDSYRRLRDGEWLRIGEHDWRVVVGHGHSPEHACLHCPSLKLLISGDQVLPKISSNVSVFPTEPEGNPLGDWLASIDRIREQVPDDVLVLPAHNEPFRGLHARLDHLARGHAKSLDRLRRSLREPRRVIDLFGALFARPIGMGSATLLSLATGESLAHLNHLIALGEVDVELDGHGVAWHRLRASGAGR